MLDGILSDITERKRAEEDLRVQKELLQTIVDHIPVMINLIGKDGQTEWVNREYERVLGWSLKEIQNRTIFSDLYPEQDYRRTVLEYIMAPPGGWKDFRTRTRDGRILETSWANIILRSKSLAFDSGAIAIQFYCIAQEAVNNAVKHRMPVGRICPGSWFGFAQGIRLILLVISLFNSASGNSGGLHDEFN